MTAQTSDVLFQAITKIRKRILRLKDRREKIGEENTKAVLIDPILQALGWNIGELEEVCREYRRKSSDNPVDYALFLLSKECLFIEAKALEKNVDERKWILQTLSYATAVGVEWCVLTNGDEYRLYNSLAPVPAGEKLFRKFRISGPSEADFAHETLLLISKEKMRENILKVLWRAHFIDSNVKVALREILSRDNAGVVRLLRKKLPSLKPSEIRESLKRADFQIEFPAISLVGDAKAAAPSPRQTGKAGKLNVSDLIEKGLIETPFHLESEFKGKKFTATIQADGTVLFNGTACPSLSMAAGMAKATLRKQRPGDRIPPANGWRFWKCRDHRTGELNSVDMLRKRG